jgi:hypothetical protein
MLKSYQRMGCFPKLEEIPEMVVDFVRRAAGLPEGTLPVYASKRTAEQHRTWVRRRAGVRYDGKRAVALEKLVEAGMELPAFSTLDHMASTVRAEVNAAICAGIWERAGEDHRAGLLRLLDVDALARKARMRARDDLAMFCKRVAIKVKKSRDELEEIRKHQQAIVEALVATYRTLLLQVDAGGPAQEAQARAAGLTGTR